MIGTVASARSGRRPLTRRVVRQLCKEIDMPRGGNFESLHSGPTQELLQVFRAGTPHPRAVERSWTSYNRRSRGRKGSMSSAWELTLVPSSHQD